VRFTEAGDSDPCTWLGRTEMYQTKGMANGLGYRRREGARGGKSLSELETEKSGKSLASRGGENTPGSHKGEERHQPSNTLLHRVGEPGKEGEE